MSNLKRPRPHAFPVFSGDMIAPLIEEFFWSISLEQTLDLAVGKPDCDTKSCLKELILNLMDECCTFILCNMPKQGIRSKEVDTILGNVLLTAFADTLQVTGKVHPKSFDCFNELFLKYVKESLRSVCSTVTSAVRYMSWSDAMDSILPHAVRLIEELLACRCKEHRQIEQKDQQQRKDHPGANSDVGHFQAEEKDTNKTPQTRETQKAKTYHTDSRGSQQFNLNLIPDIFEKLDSEVATDETYNSNPVSENQESDLKMVDEFILEELSKITHVHDLISNERKPDIKVVEEFIAEEVEATHLILKEKESCLEMMEEEDRPLADAEQESMVATKVAEKEEQQQSIMLLVNEVLIKTITNSRVTCRYNHLQAIIERLSEKVCAEVKEQELKDIQSNLNNLSKDILRAVCKNLGCSKKDVLLLLGLKSSAVEETLISICTEKIVKPAKKPSLIKRFWASISKKL